MQISKKQLESEELLAKLIAMYDDHADLDEIIDTATEDRTILKDEIKALIANIQPTDERVEILLEDEGKKGWDRQVKHKGGGIDLRLLKAALGTSYEELCDEVVTWEFNQDKLDLALTRGLISEKTLQDCTVKPTLIPSLTRR